MKPPILALTLVTGLLVACNGKKSTSSETPPAKTPIERHIPLDGEPNLRDIGGYQAADGKTVKTGLIYRSGKLSTISDNDVKKLEDLNIKTVVSFLTPNEIASTGEDRLPDGVKRIYFPIDVDMGQGTSVDGMIEARKTGDFSNVPPEVNPDIHRVLIQKAREPYTQLFHHLADPANHPVVFHCSHGIHRTGTATALILSTLGVPWETIRKDYLLSNTYRKEQITKRTEQLKQLHAKNTGIDPSEVDMTNINAFYILEGKYIDASLDEAVKEYGSMEKYIREGLGITDEEIAKLRSNLLETAK